jgi:hypothetical protein
MSKDLKEQRREPVITWTYFRISSKAELNLRRSAFQSFLN